MRADRVCLAFAAALSVWLGAATASAFCRTTTCDAVNPNANCTHDNNGCAAGGPNTPFPYLYWPQKCSWFGVAATGDLRHGFSYQTLHTTVSDAFKAWGNAPCEGGGRPSFSMQDTDLLYGPIDCAKHQYNLTAANANVWTFIGENWPHQAEVIAATTLTIDNNTGEILDTDVELNSDGSTQGGATLAGGSVENLKEVVQHESGHFLGLGHSPDSTAVMYKYYSSNDLKLTPDDIDGICAVYPPGNQPACPEPAPRTGFSKFCDGGDPSTKPEPQRVIGCGCRVVPSNPTPPTWPLGALGFLALLGRRRSRRGPVVTRPASGASPRRRQGERSRSEPRGARPPRN